MNAELIDFLGMLAELSGTVSIAYAALSVHHRFRHEHKVDEEVFSAMSQEMRVGVLGICLILVGFCAQIFGKFIL
ncbi:TPA: hypothetical protein EYO12_00845 [Candidatus Saccharibacteria bacterium]|nr:hypothetical protein [Candidatus Saccharibacteria bacterium]HIO87265.1 hypothetical protein [Candidatus Saccharibacteria bacterium]